jgi:hypothetical protein
MNRGAGRGGFSHIRNGAPSVYVATFWPCGSSLVLSPVIGNLVQLRDLQTSMDLAQSERCLSLGDNKYLPALFPFENHPRDTKGQDSFRWLVGWLIDQIVGWLVGWLVGGSVMVGANLQSQSLVCGLDVAIQANTTLFPCFDRSLW